MLSVVLAIVSVAVGAWLALGSGRFERGIREELALETPVHRRAVTEFVVVSDTPVDHAMDLQDLEQLEAGGLSPYGPVARAVERARNTVRAAAVSPAPPEHQVLQHDAAALWQAYPDEASIEGYLGGFDWTDAAQVEYLRDVVSRGMVPRVELYASPLGLRGVLLLVGLTAGGILLTLSLVIVPLLAGVGVAQEVHENTLQPLTGTALAPRQLVVGLAAGPSAFVAVVALPQVVLVALTGAAMGRFVPTLALLVIASVGAFCLTMLAQLLAFTLGKRRTPGPVGASLLVFLGTALLLGLAVSMHLDVRSVGVLVLSPQASSIYVLWEIFLFEHLQDTGVSASALALRVGAGVVAGLVFALTALLAFERRIGGAAGPALRRGEALVAAFFVVASTVTSMPPGTAGRDTYLVSLVLSVLPLQLLLIGRFPATDIPPSMRRVPLRALGLEFASWIGLHFVLCGLQMEPLHAFPLGLALIGWSLAIACLVAVRAAALPVRIWSTLWLGLCMVLMLVTYVTGAMFVSGHDDLETLFVLWTLSPVLGVAQAVLTVFAPYWLVRTLARKTGGLA